MTDGLGVRDISGSRALRFVHPERSDVSITAGLSATPAGTLGLVGGDAAVRQSLLLLLATMPGERVMRPDYGCPLHRLVFQPLDDTTAGLAIHYVEQAVRRWEPRIEILGVDAHRSVDHPSELLVTLHYRVRTTRREDAVALAVDVEAGP